MYDNIGMYDNTVTFIFLNQINTKNKKHIFFLQDELRDTNCASCMDLHLITVVQSRCLRHNSGLIHADCQ